MSFSSKHSNWAFIAGLLLAGGACGAKEGEDEPPAIQNDSGSGAAGLSGAPSAGSGGSTITNPVVGATAGEGAGAGAGAAGAAGSTMAGSGAVAGAAGMAMAGAGGAGMGGVAGMTAGMGGSGDAGSAGEAGSSAPQVKPKCKTSPRQVIVIGDSYINWLTHTFPEDLTREAGEMWRMYAVGGCSLGSGGLCLIPDQLDQAIAEDPNIIAGVMTGGGNDILIADELMFPGGGACKDLPDAPMMKVCQDIVKTATAAGDKLMNDAAAAGMRDVIYMFYPHIPGGGFGGMNPKYMLDYALPMARELCEGAEQRTEGKLRCHFIDLVPVFEGHPDWFADDGIHENALGSAAMAKEVVKVAKEKCIAQPASSGCCEP